MELCWHVLQPVVHFLHIHLPSDRVKSIPEISCVVLFMVRSKRNEESDLKGG